jgi:hypothetical protein
MLTSDAPNEARCAKCLWIQAASALVSVIGFQERAHDNETRALSSGKQFRDAQGE